MPARVRVVPLAVLVTTVICAVVARRPDRIVAAGVSTPPPATEAGESGRTTGLAAPLPRGAQRVADRSGRMLHEDPRRTHRAHGRIPRAPETRWKFEADGPVEAQPAASPDGEALYVATLGGTLFALGRDGTKRWTAPLGGRGYGSPTVAEDGTVYVGSDGGAFFAVSATGQVKWRLETGSDADTGSAILPDGVIVFGAGSALYGVRPSGDLVFRFATRGKVFSSPALTDDGLVVFGSQDDHVYALTPQGALSWAVDLGADVDGAPAIGDDGGIFVGTDAGEVLRLGRRGQIVWRKDVGGFVRGGLAVARNGDVLAGVYGPTPREVRITADGVLRGALAIPGTGATEFGVHGGALEDDDGTLVFGAQDDRVRAVDRDGKVLWTYATRGDVDAPLTLLADGTLLVGSDDGYVYALSDGPPR